MKKIKHTQGPWVVQNPDVFKNTMFKEDAIIGPVIGPQIALVYTDSARDLANARLITAAPDMLEALEELMANTLESGGTSIGSVKLANMIRKAIAKAKGAE